MHNLSVFTIIFLLSYTARANGQCTTSVCKDCNSGSEEIVLRRLEELDQRLQMMYKRMNVPTALQNLQDSVSASEQRILRRLQELQQNPMNDKPNSTSAHQILQDHCRGNPVVCDCSSIKDNGYTTSGVYLLYVVHQGKRYYAFAYCDMKTADSGWTVFQRRKDGTVDFYRGWNDYENGFGNPNGEFWLGNEFLHLLTSKKSYRLRVDLKDFEGGETLAEFFPFSISSSRTNTDLRLACIVEMQEIVFDAITTVILPQKTLIMTHTLATALSIVVEPGGTTNATIQISTVSISAEITHRVAQTADLKELNGSIGMVNTIH